MPLLKRQIKSAVDIDPPESDGALQCYVHDIKDAPNGICVRLVQRITT